MSMHLLRDRVLLRYERCPGLVCLYFVEADDDYEESKVNRCPVKDASSIY